jgi:Ca-activated chloride channel family protein
MKTLSVPLLAPGALCAFTLLCAASLGQAAMTAASETVFLRVAPERDLVYRRGPREVVLEVELKAKRPESSRRSPVNVSVVLDRSGSMEGAKLEKARQAASVALDSLDPEDVFSLVVYDNEAEVLISPERVGSRQRREELKERISRIRTGGSTALYAGVQLGAKQVRKFLDKERVNRVILLSDGIANVGPSRTSDLTRLGRDLREDGLSVTTIGLGDDFNEDLMTALAESSHANYYYVQDAEKLPGIFREELGAAGTRVAGDIRLRIEVPEGVRLRDVLGHPEIACKERNVEIILPELFGAEQRLYHLRCALDESSAESLPLATAALSYEDTASKKRQTQNQSTVVRLTDDQRKADDSIQNDIAKNVAVLQNRIDKETAVRLADEGRAKEAATLLRQRAVTNAAAPAAQQMPGASAENQKLEGLAEELATRGSLGKASRKAAQYDNYRDKYQKK